MKLADPIWNEKKNPITLWKNPKEGNYVSKQKLRYKKRIRNLEPEL